MGAFKSILASGAKGAVRAIAVRAGTKIGSAAYGAYKSGNFKLPDVNMPNVLENLGVKLDTGAELKLPGGLEGYVSKPARDAISKIGLPTEINGVPLPGLPDYSSVAPQVENMFKSVGISTDKLGIRSVDEILKNTDLLKMEINVPAAARVINADNVPDINKMYDGFDVSFAQQAMTRAIDEIPNIPENINLDSVKSVDISKYW